MVEVDASAALLPARPRHEIDVLVAGRLVTVWEFTLQQNRARREVRVAMSDLSRDAYGIGRIALEFRPRTVVTIKELNPGQPGHPLTRAGVVRTAPGGVKRLCRGRYSQGLASRELLIMTVHRMPCAGVLGGCVGRARSLAYKITAPSNMIVAGSNVIHGALKDVRHRSESADGISQGRPNETARGDTTRLQGLLFIRAFEVIYETRRPDIVFSTHTTDAMRLLRDYRDVVARLIGDQPISYLEFGVFSGNSMKEIAKRFPSPDARFTGFDAIRALFAHGAVLTLYSVGAVTEGIDAQARVTVRLREDGETVDGQGADTDTIVASARAYVHALNKLLVKRVRTEPVALSA